MSKRVGQSEQEGGANWSRKDRVEVGVLLMKNEISMTDKEM